MADQGSHDNMGGDHMDHMNMDGDQMGHMNMGGGQMDHMGQAAAGHTGMGSEHGGHEHQSPPSEGQHAMPGMAMHHGMAMGQHGMLVVGEAPVYMSHLPMFMFHQAEAGNPHNFQIIMEVTLTGHGSDPQQEYVQDRRRTGARLYTFNPEAFNLFDIVPAAPGQPPRSTSFTGTLFRNHFETFHPTHPEPPEVLAKHVVVSVKKVVLFRQFERNPAPLPQLQYVLFGKGQELFLAHVITRPPDFDHVLAARVGGHTFTDEELSQGVRVSFPNRPNAINQRLREGEHVNGTAQMGGASAPQTVPLQIEVGTDFYFETGDLETAEFDPPPE